MEAGKTAKTHAGCMLSNRVVPGPDTKIDTCNKIHKQIEAACELENDTVAGDSTICWATIELCNLHGVNA